jgi:hypothetical protein
MRRNIMRCACACLTGAAFFAGVGCSDTGTSYTGYQDGTYYGFNDPANLHVDMSWTPYVSQYGANTGVTGSSASPYVGGGIINQKPDPVPPSRANSNARETSVYTSPAPKDATIDRRRY